MNVYTTEEILKSVTLKDQLTGEIKKIEDRSGMPFMWTTGNYNCDCNRGGMFYDSMDYDCGSERFIVVDVEGEFDDPKWDRLDFIEAANEGWQVTK